MRLISVSLGAFFDGFSFASLIFCKMNRSMMVCAQSSCWNLGGGGFLIGEKAQCFERFEASSEKAFPVSVLGNKKRIVSAEMIGA
ncbi:MAG: hypothetical protein VX269_00180, partial [Verrucomicrobiota bacterium]|nr:hypothetical protein [Verrucomicrobiota bacterium]